MNDKIFFEPPQFLNKNSLSVIITFFCSLIFMLFFSPLYSFAIGPNFDYYTKVKMEYQYTDYFEYRWPNYINYFFGEQDFSQPSPFLAKFPEHRALIKVTQAFGSQAQLAMKYQYSFLEKVYEYDQYGNSSVSNDVQELYNARLEYEVSNSFSINSSGQYTKASKNFDGYMADAGFKYDFGGFFMVEPSASFYWNFVGGSRQQAQSYNLQLRQALTNTTATQVKYNYFHAIGAQGFSFYTITCWISQWLPTKTALHLSLRYHWDTVQGESIAPGIEVAQYLNWATTLNVSYRFFTMKNNDPNSLFHQQVIGDSFDSNSITAILTRTMWNDTVLMIKYRYYTCNQDVRMNTYLVGIEQVF